MTSAPQPPPSSLFDSLPDYHPRWRSSPLAGDLHTIAAFVQSPAGSLDEYPSTRLQIPTTDGTGDTLVASCYRPKGVAADAAPTSALVILLHGLGGHAQSVYMRRSALHLLENGRDVLLFNFRGAGDSRSLCKRHNHPGRTEDLVDLMTWLGDRQARQMLSAGCVIAAYSLGANILLKFLGERESTGDIGAGVSVSGPLDLGATSTRLGAWRNLVYRAYLIKRLRERLLGDESLSPEAKDTVRSVTSIRELDARFVAPRAGFDSVDDYYRAYSATDDLQRIATPTLLLYAQDDPFIPSDTYLAFDWDRCPQLHAKVVAVGGHTGFQCADAKPSWHDQCLLHLAKHLR